MFESELENNLNYKNVRKLYEGKKKLATLFDSILLKEFDEPYKSFLENQINSLKDKYKQAEDLQDEIGSLFPSMIDLQDIIIDFIVSIHPNREELKKKIDEIQ
jgi:hypothetical protein